MPTEITDTTQATVFPCIEKNCNGKVNRKKIATFLKTGCHSSSQACCCDKCGRLYMAGNGNPASNRRYEKAFWVNDTVEFKPMDSTEKVAAVNTLIVSGEKKELIPAFYQDQMSFLLGLGHANDCPAKDTIGECVCGHAEAEKWLREHKNVSEE